MSVNHEPLPGGAPISPLLRRVGRGGPGREGKEMGVRRETQEYKREIDTTRAFRLHEWRLLICRCYQVQLLLEDRGKQGYLSPTAPFLLLGKNGNWKSEKIFLSCCGEEEQGSIAI